MTSPLANNPFSKMSINEKLKSADPFHAAKNNTEVSRFTRFSSKLATPLSLTENSKPMENRQVAIEQKQASQITKATAILPKGKLFSKDQVTIIHPKKVSALDQQELKNNPHNFIPFYFRKEADGEKVLVFKSHKNYLKGKKPDGLAKSVGGIMNFHVSEKLIKEKGFDFHNCTIKAESDLDDGVRDLLFTSDRLKVSVYSDEDFEEMIFLFKEGLERLNEKDDEQPESSTLKDSRREDDQKINKEFSSKDISSIQKKEQKNKSSDESFFFKETESAKDEKAFKKDREKKKRNFIEEKNKIEVKKKIKRSEMNEERIKKDIKK